MLRAYRWAACVWYGSSSFPTEEHFETNYTWTVAEQKKKIYCQKYFIMDFLGGYENSDAMSCMNKGGKKLTYLI